MTASNNNRQAGSKTPRLAATPVFMCLYCAQAMKGELQDMMKPAITLVPIFVQGFPVAVPVCFDHLQAGSKSNLAIG